MENMCPGKMSSTKTNRKSSKQVMERKRRGRMTTCLAELKSLLTEVIKTEALGVKQNKIEQADILDMTVRYLRGVKRNKSCVENNSSTPKISKYQLGYSECASEVSKYLANVDEVGTDLRSRLLNHLTDINMSSHKDTESIDYNGLVSSRNSSPNQMFESPHVDALLNHDRNHTGTTLYTPPGNRGTCKTREANKEMVEETSCTVVNNAVHNDVISGSVTSGDVAYLIPATSLFQFGNVPYPSSNVVIRVLQPIPNSTGACVPSDTGTGNSPNIAIVKQSKTLESVLPTDQSFHSRSPTPMNDVTKEDVVSDDSRPRYLSLPLQLPSSCNQSSQNDVIKDCNYLHIKRDTSKHQNQMWRPW